MTTSCGILCWTFRAATAADMTALGRAFARAARLDRRPAGLPHDILHIGLKAAKGTGKSTFAAGFRAALGGRVAYQHPFGRHTQSLSETKDAGWVRHYDALLGSYFPPRHDFTLETKGLAGTDLAEHPQADYRPYQGADYREILKCDYLVALRKADGGGRLIRVWCHADKVDTPGFRDFLHAASPFLRAGPKAHDRDNRAVAHYLR